MSLESRMGRILLRRSFSKILERLGSKLIGLKDLGSLGGFLGLGIMVMMEYFHWMGK